MTMQEKTGESAPEVFQPLVTQAQAISPGHSWLEEGSGSESARDLPRGLGVLARAGSLLKRSLLVSLVLGTVSLAELGVLLLFPRATPRVVWEERSVKPLVELFEEVP